MRETLDNFHSKAVEVFKKAGDTEEELKWLTGSTLALFPAHREEVRLRLRTMEEIVRRAEGKILDVGSGSGLLALALSEKGTVIGVEKRADFFPFLRELESGDLRFIRADFLSDDVGRDFDTVVFSYTLHDLEPESFIKRAADVLSPGGRILVGDFDLNGLREKVKELTGLYGLLVSEELVLGWATSHGRECDAFLLVLKKQGG
ncbi:class I SAM-dependent methyltransferase [Pyrococcus yayanosii]|uniref:SAM-dependent methyltransferase n=1 Tax=Pyrococcus yayanosii (strain CH1 / JCM 16557) TaxID=529709 RepID=F8AFP8_PYRYC|nr:methyltransferase domain-containing protein [Pyrococcus yayanosii]AEH25024.1 SAM-dependent methyltransferase [Pyrococcus yayanosii CH1]